MADGSSYEIGVTAESSGVETAADRVNRLAASLDAASAVSTSFDAVIAETQSLLAAAASASQAASDAVAASSTKYGQLEAAADRAARAVDKAAAAGGASDALRAKASDAAAALQEQGAALEAARADAAACASAQSQLAASLKTLEAAAKAEAAAMKSAAKESEAMAKASSVASADVGKASASLGAASGKLDEGTKKALGPLGEKIERLGALKNLLGQNGMAAAAVVATVAVVALTAAVALGVLALAKMAVTLNKVAMAKIDKISKKAQENFAKLFSGVQVDKFVKALDSVSGVLDENSATAKGLKTILSALLNPLFSACEALAPIVKELFRGMVLGALMIAIAVVKTRNAIAKLIPADVAPKINWLKVAFYAGIVVMGIVAAVLVGLTGLFVIFAVAIFVANLPLMLLIAALVILAAILLAPIIAIVLLIAYFDEIMAYFGKLASSAAEAGRGIIDGLVNSVTSGAGMVFDALKNLGAGAMGALKAALGIASPSKFAASFGANVTRTFSDTIEDGSSDAGDAMSKMAEPPDMPSKGQAGKGGAGSRGAVSLSNVTFVFNGVKGAEEARAQFEETLTAILSGDVLAAGGAPA